MGCRTQANAFQAERMRQLNNRMQGSLEGTAVRKDAAPEIAPARITPRRRRNPNAALIRALKKQRLRFAVLSGTAVVVFVVLCAFLFSAIQKNDTLSSRVAGQEKDVQELTVFNDAREYEINSSVDLNYVISVATQDLGMVRSNASQIVTYSVKNTEYLQQVAQVPTD